MKIRIDLSKCQGHGRCYSVAPDLFEPTDDDGHAAVMMDPIPAEWASYAEEALRGCPEHAITTDEVEESHQLSVHRRTT